jgi:SAM-dependent methyltransferase
MAEQSFRALEHEGWFNRAAGYDDILTKLTGQAIAPILDTFASLQGKRFLDVACGTGHLVSAAAQRGALSEGIDFAATMIERAQANYPSLQFAEGDAEQLPYADACFDAVACSFGLLHLAQPEQAMKEAGRVLKPGGRYTFTVWCSPDQGGDFFRLVLGAIQQHGTFDVPLPSAPPFFRFADLQEAARVLTSVGFIAPEFKLLPLTWQATQPQAILNLLYQGTVRTSLLLGAQTESARERIHHAILEGAQAYQTPSGVELRFPAHLATAVKA